MPSPGTEVDAGLELQAGLTLQLGRLADGLEAARARDQKLQQAIMSVTLKAKQVTVAGGVALILSTEHDLGPPDGYAWAVQRLSVSGLAGTDILSFYKGPPFGATVAPTNFVNNVSVASPIWNPGRTGLMLFKGDSIVAAGSALSATTVTLTGEVIQLEQWIVPQFLL